MLKSSFNMRLVVTLILLLLLSSNVVNASGQVIGPGDIAFVGYNADADKDLAFVLLGDAVAEQLVYISDNEWNGLAIGGGGAFIDTNEGSLAWTVPAGGLAAGTVIVMNDIGTSTPVANHGSVSRSGGFNPATSDEVLYAYLGTDANTPLAFLAAIANRDFTPTLGTLENTGLTVGTHAVNLGAVDLEADIGEYTGSRANQDDKSGYLPQINNATNWITQDGTGDQSNDATAPDLPFNTTTFTRTNAVVVNAVVANAKPVSPMIVLGLAGGIIVFRKRR